MDPRTATRFMRFDEPICLHRTLTSVTPERDVSTQDVGLIPTAAANDSIKTIVFCEPITSDVDVLRHNSNTQAHNGWRKILAYFISGKPEVCISFVRSTVFNKMVSLVKYWFGAPPSIQSDDSDKTKSTRRRPPGRRRGSRRRPRQARDTGWNVMVVRNLDPVIEKCLEVNESTFKAVAFGIAIIVAIASWVVQVLLL